MNYRGFFGRFVCAPSACLLSGFVRNGREELEGNVVGIGANMYENVQVVGEDRGERK